MALYAISDLHLPLGVDKPMDIFGKNWENYVVRLENNWRTTIGDDDVVVLPGDFSWATYIEDARADFEFLDKLPGKKILLKGNHDYWWTTMNKMKEFLAREGFSTIEILQNNSFEYKDISICGSRGWITPTGEMSAENQKFYDRELGRLELSVKSAKHPENIIIFMHYPPVLKDFRENGMTRLFKRYNIAECVFGHIHSSGIKNAYEGEDNGIKYTLVSCDYREFMPVKIRD